LHFGSAWISIFIHVALGYARTMKIPVPFKIRDYRGVPHKMSLFWKYFDHFRL